jgi:2-polyprenyl-3-methyl-5-hydroxy-6-metoxy-1,4-benzoquinol methylase
VPTDLGLIVANLTSFYDFRRKAVVHVGAGGGQLMGYASLSRRVTAVDKDEAAIRRLEQRIQELALEDTVSVVHADFQAVEPRGDVVLLEFCLHEMPEPHIVIERARALAPDVVVIDHLPNSPWAWYANEEAEMARAWEAVAAAGTRRRCSYQARQCFATYGELRDKLSSLGEESRKRVGSLRDQTAIEIPMPYGIALL